MSEKGRKMTQKGAHTWDLVIDYQRCPKCGFIIENREEFHQEMGSWIKQISCDRCATRFTVKDKYKQTFFPLIGRAQPPEITWE